HRAAGPGFAREFVVPFVHHAVFAGLRALHLEIGRVHDDADPAVVPVEAECQYWQAGLQRDLDAVVLRQREPVHRRELLLREEHDRHFLQPPFLVGGQSAQKRQVLLCAPPQRAVDAVTLEDAFAFPVAEPAHLTLTIAAWFPSSSCVRTTRSMKGRSPSRVRSTRGSCFPPASRGGRTRWA